MNTLEIVCPEPSRVSADEVFSATVKIACARPDRDITAIHAELVAIAADVPIKLPSSKVFRTLQSGEWYAIEIILHLPGDGMLLACFARLVDGKLAELTTQMPPCFTACRPLDTPGPAAS